ncbi:hypothetical protein Pcinc_006121 [Petrolisthes cinctipes]|uniref:E3 UFM1-protein ligase 1 homolog n=1 Tax=Petrolisthes cinctipes TaxID=88211 RepID=A0AAE1GDX2_PETCI|nr:hypothetical protein Pcinc_006121 [Petrolisthes cinctipes]
MCVCYRLSERNVVEIIIKLRELNLLEVYHTDDGKEYITPNQLCREIHDEAIINGGRVSITDLVPILAVDHSLVEKQTQVLVASQPDLHFLLGQLLTKEYLDGVAEEINEKLQQLGTITIGELVKRYDLPGEFMEEVVRKRLKSIIRGQQDSSDSRVLYTEGFQKSLFFSETEKLITSHRISGILTGNRQITQANYLPGIYTRTQNNWVDNFFKQNGYLEFQALRRLEIPNPESHIKHHYKDYDLTFMGDVCVGPGLRDQVEASIDDAILRATWVDIYPLLPSVFSIDECSQLVELCLRRRSEAGGGRRGDAGGRVVGGTVVVSDVLITRLSEHLTQLMPQRAKAAVDRGAFKEQVSSGKVRMDDDDGGKKDKKDDRRKRAAGGKSGGGTQGRETKTKATKNKGRGKRQATHDSDSDDEHKQKHNQDSKLVEFLSAEEMKTEVTNFPELEDCPEDVLEELAGDLLRPLTQHFQEVARGVFQATLNAEGWERRRRTHQQLQDKVLALLTTIKLSEKSLKVFDEDMQVQLRRHLLRTQCTELVNELLLYLAHQSHINLPDNPDLTPEMRVKIIQKLDEDTSPPLLSVNKTLVGAGLEEFHKAVDEAVAAAGIMLKKKDNKKDRQVLLSHRAALLEQLAASLDAPLTLRLACLVLFQTVTGNMLHASGKFVPHVLAFLKTHLPDAHFITLHQYQELVIKSLTSKGDNEEESSIKLELERLAPTVKEIAITFKKTTGGSQTTEE